MSMFPACCCTANNTCLGCSADPLSFRLDFAEITYKGGGGLTASASWDNGVGSCNDGYRFLSSTREFPDISDFGNATILTREDVENSACAWGVTDAEVWGERREQVASPRCDCSTSSASVYGGTTLGTSHHDWDVIGATATAAQFAARPADCGNVSICGFGESNTVLCSDEESRLGVRAVFGADAAKTVWQLTLQWRQLTNITWRRFDSFGGTGLTLGAEHGNFGSEFLTTFSGADKTAAYTNVFQQLWPDCSASNPSTGDMQWTYEKAFDCDDLDGLPMVLTLQDQVATNQMFANNYVNNPPTTVTVVKL